MGPNIILDKSTFQGLSHEEHVMLWMYFKECVTVTLFREVQGDLAKQDPKGARAKVQELARKFMGSGGVVNMDYLTLGRESLLGATIPMTGQIIPIEASSHRDEQGRLGVVIGLSWFNRTILRWADGIVSASEEADAAAWRSAGRSLSFTALQQALTKQHLLLPAPTSPTSTVATAESLLREPGLQELWLKWLIQQLGLSQSGGDRVLRRWATRPQFQLLKGFAPYAHHCLRATLALLVAVRHRYVSWQPTHMVDLQYLYYLPFCQVFASDDKVHRLLAPQLLRRNQDFVRGSELKADLHRIKAERDALPEGSEQRKEYHYGNLPPQPDDSVVQRLRAKGMSVGGIGAED